MEDPSPTDDPPNFGPDSDRSWEDVLEMPPFESHEAASLAWSSPIGDDASANGIPASPTVVDGSVYVANGTSLYAIGREDGSVSWRYDATFGTYCSPTVVAGTAYLVTVFGSVLAIDTRAGQPRWESESGREYGLLLAETAPSPLVVDGTVYVGKSPANLYAYDADSGDQEWTFGTDGRIVASSVWHDGSVLVPTVDGTLYAVDASDGTENWSVSIEGIGFGSPTVADGTAFIGSRTGAVHAIDPADGERLWTADRDGEILATPTVADGTVFVADRDDLTPALLAFETESGDARWTSDRGSAKSSPTVAGERVYVGGSHVQGHDIGSGEREIVFTEVAGGFSSSPTVVDGTIYVGGPGEDLLAIDTDTDATSRGSRIREGSHGHIESLQGVRAGAGTDGTGSRSGKQTNSSGGDDSLAGPGILGSAGGILGARYLLARGEDQPAADESDATDD